MLLVVVSCGGNEEESRLTKKNSTPTVTQAQEAGTPTPTLTPATEFTSVEYEEKLKQIAGILDQY